MMATATMRMTEPAQPTVDLPTGFGAREGILGNDHVGWMRPTAKDTPISEIRKRFAEDGYVFVKNLLPRKDVLKVRKAYVSPLQAFTTHSYSCSYFSSFESTGILKPGTSHEDGIFNSAKDPVEHGGLGAGTPFTEEEMESMLSSHSHEDYLHFLEHPDLRNMVRDIMEWDKEVLLTRTMLRHNLPGGLGTGIHYDKLFLRYGGAYCLTAWVPVGMSSVNIPPGSFTWSLI